jgi:prepilin peptidase CpaA
MGFYFSRWSGAQVGINPAGLMVIDAVLLLVIVYCAYTDTTTGKIFNKITFPAMLAGIVLNAVFGGATGLVWALIGWAAGMAIQWVPFMLGFAKAGDVKLLAAVGALKGWAFCLFGFLYGAAAFGFILVPWLARRGELKSVQQNLRGYFAAAAITQSVPDAPTPTVTRRYVPWGLGLVIGFVIALVLERIFGRPTWIDF